MPITEAAHHGVLAALLLSPGRFMRHCACPQLHSSQLDQLHDAWGHQQQPLFEVSRVVIGLHLLHSKLGMTQQSVLGELHTANGGRWHYGLQT